MTEPERVPELVCQHQVEVGGVVELEDMNLALGRNQTSVPDVDGLLESRDLIGLGAAADTKRRQKHGDRVTFVRLVSAAQASFGSWESQRPAERRSW